MNLEIIKASFHRNGVAGIGFYAIIFKDRDEDKTMIASLFNNDESGGYCAVYDIDGLQKHNIEFARGNSWRGDRYESVLKPLLEKYLETEGTNRIGPFALPA